MNPRNENEDRPNMTPGEGSRAAGDPGAEPARGDASEAARPGGRGNTRRGPGAAGSRRPATRRSEAEPFENGQRGQAGAINRSRPIYPEAAGRGRSRNGGGANGRGGPWRGGVPRGGVARDATRRGERPGLRASAAPAERLEEDGPPLPTNPREAALRILHAVDTRGAFSDRMLDGAHAHGSRGGPDPRDLGLMHELVKGTLRWRGRLDWALDPRVHIGLARVQPWIKNVLRMGAYQILFLDRIPSHAAVDEAVKLAHKYGHPGTAGLANSVLRRLADEKDTIVPPEGDDAASLAVWGSHPQWLVERWLARFGVEDTRALMLADNRAVPVGLRVNRLRGTREQLIEKLAAEGVTASPARYSPDLAWVEGHHAPGSLAAFREGWCTAQDESESLVGRLTAPQPHERLLDLCAAPGGKCTHLAELMGDEGEVWAMERADARALALEHNLERLATHSVHVVRGDGRTYNFPMPFDRVLVDAPCSGLGVLGRRADARWRKGPEVLREMPPIQLDLLAAGGRRARPGGVLVYSVCSFEPEETVAVVERFLRQSPSFVLESASGLLPDEVVDENGFMRVLPQVHGCDGAFAARFRRT
ncbi:MAG TPA: 16S rRNA (cytosine(967)-C(5))-methyltransferase RsmB [Candidatus Eisenbacteria bacterium]